MASSHKLEVTGPPEGWVPVETIGVLKCLDEDGDVALHVFTSEHLSTWEAVGMLRAGVLWEEDTLSCIWEDEEEDSDDEPVS